MHSPLVEGLGQPHKKVSITEWNTTPSRKRRAGPTKNVKFNESPFSASQTDAYEQCLKVEYDPAPERSQVSGETSGTSTRRHSLLPKAPLGVAPLPPHCINLSNRFEVLSQDEVTQESSLTPSSKEENSVMSLNKEHTTVPPKGGYAKDRQTE